MQNIVDEANLAFQLNCNVMHELVPLVKAAIGDRAFDLVTLRDKPGSTDRHQRGQAPNLVSAEH